jgi:LacI family transcriptional regulator
MATLRDVARQANTSVASVSAVLNGVAGGNIRVGSATRQRILSIASELGYVPNHVARSLVTRKTGTLGLVFPYSSAFIDTNPFCTQVMSGVFEGAVRSRYNLMLHTAIGENWSEVDEEALVDSRVDGLILVLPRPGCGLIERPRTTDFHVVGVVYEPKSPDAYVVNADDYTGGLLAGRHLVHLGHRRIAHLAGSASVATSEPRKAGFMAALHEAGIEPDPDLIIDSGFDWRDGRAAMETLLRRPESRWPTAIFAANDLCAAGAKQCLDEQGLLVPRDMSLVGYDDSWLTGVMTPALTSVRMPIREMGVLATEMLVARVEGRDVIDRQPELPVSLSVRESTDAPNRP